MSRTAWLIFLSLQGVGVVFNCASSHTLGPNPLLSGIGVGLLVSGNLLLLPGSMVELIVIHEFPFHSGLSIGLLSLAGIIVAVVTNLVVWLLWAKLFRSV